MSTSTTEFAPREQVIHPIYGIGVVIGMVGHYLVAVQWSGLTMARREPIENVTRYVAPAPVKRRRRAGS